MRGKQGSNECTSVSPCTTQHPISIDVHHHSDITSLVITDQSLRADIVHVYIFTYQEKYIEMGITFILYVFAFVCSVNISESA